MRLNFFKSIVGDDMFHGAGLLCSRFHIHTQSREHPGQNLMALIDPPGNGFALFGQEQMSVRSFTMVSR